VNKLEKFLVYHASRMQQCFVLEHFDVGIMRVKNIRAAMDVSVDYEYLDVVIRYGKQVETRWALGQKEQILETLAHELTHILTGEITDGLTMSKTRNKAEERATEHISRLLLRLYRRRK